MIRLATLARLFAGPQTQTPCTAPVALEAAALSLVAGGLPKGGWGAESTSGLPKGGWGAESTSGLPKGGWGIEA